MIDPEILRDFPKLSHDRRLKMICDHIWLGYSTVPASWVKWLLDEYENLILEMKEEHE